MPKPKSAAKKASIHASAGADVQPFRFTPWAVAGMILISFLLLFRFYDLGIRPPHHDEAVNGWFVDGMFSKGYYQYDPQNYHGPLFFYILALFRLVFGRSIEALRIPIVLVSWLVTASPFLFRKWLGDKACWIAVCFLTVSPAMVFYSRYTIHELEFALASIVFFFYWLHTREESFSKKNILGLGFSLGAMACLKENFVIYVGSLIFAEAITVVYEKLNSSSVVGPSSRYFQNPKKTLLGGAVVIAIAFAIVLLIYSAFGRDENGISNFFRAFGLWTDTGSKGNGHQKPFFYWISVLGSLEWFAFLGLLLTPLALFRMSSMLRLMSVLSFGLCLGYSIVSYKTPWCLLSFYWGFILIASYWFGSWMKSKSSTPMISALLALGFAVSYSQAYSVSYVNVDEENHYYIYGQTYRDLMVPLNEIVESAKKDPRLLDQVSIQVLSTFTWPLPYVLGEFRHSAYFGEQNAPQFFDGDYVFIDSPLDAKYSSRLKGNYTRQVVRARQWAQPIVIYTKR